MVSHCEISIVIPVFNEAAGQQFSARQTALLHFTDMNTQPWVSKENPLGYLWTGDLIEAIDAGAVSIDFVKHEIAAGHVRPSLMYQVENRIQDALLLPRRRGEWIRNSFLFTGLCRNILGLCGSVPGIGSAYCSARPLEHLPLYDWFFR